MVEFAGVIDAADRRREAAVPTRFRRPRPARLVSGAALGLVALVAGRGAHLYSHTRISEISCSMSTGFVM